MTLRMTWTTMSSDGSVSVKPLSGTDAWVVVRAIAPANGTDTPPVCTEPLTRYTLSSVPA